MNLQQLEQQFNEARTTAQSLLNKFTVAANAEGRPLGPGERSAIDDAVRTAQSLKARVERARGDADMTREIERLTNGMMPARPGSPQTGGSSGRSGGSLGAQVMNTDVMKWLQANRGQLPAGTWSSPMTSEIEPLQLMATTVDESAGVGGPIVIPQYVPTIVPTPTRPLRVADLIAPGVANSNTIIYLKELTWTNASASTAEGAAAPESALTFGNVNQPVQKITTFVPVSEEMLDDVAAMQSYLDQRLSLGVQLAEDLELLSGTGVSPHLSGFTTRAGLSATQARGADNNADCVLKQIGALQAAVFVRPDGIVMHPTNWQTILLSKDANGRYYGDSPFGTSNASPLWGQPVAPTPTQTLWGLPVAITPAITLNTALVGCFRTQAQLFRRTGLQVTATNSHSDFFQKGLIAIRAMLRESLVVYREAAFGLCSGLT
jgi:HK97 family phage major capsid protein